MPRFAPSDGRREEFHRFAQAHIAPYAEEQDRFQRFRSGLVDDLASAGYLAPFLPARWGGQDLSMTVLGQLHEEVGRACSSVRSLLTVHGMAAFTIHRWGKPSLRERWLTRLAAGSAIGALAVSEPNAGSDLNDVETTAEKRGDIYIINGTKKWITCGQIASAFIVLARTLEGPCAFLVDRDTPGLSISPIMDVLGTRGSMVAQLDFINCEVGSDHLLASPGAGTLVAVSALGFGRFSVACGAVGIIQASLDASLAYTSSVRRSGVFLREHQLVRQLITNMATDAEAARLLCHAAGELTDRRDPAAVRQTFIAKYFASTSAVRAALDAVQLHGANGCTTAYPVERYLRDAKITEIIEGSTQVQQSTIADLIFQSHSTPISSDH